MTVSTELASDAPPRDGARDFDFFIGSWNVRHRRLRHPLSGETEWYSFFGTSVMRTTLGGAGNVDDNVLAMPQGTLYAITVRFYDAATRQWSIYWGTGAHGLVTIPTVGAFGDDGVGYFYNDEEFEGKPITVRFTWTRIDAERCRWEQAFSADHGATWESNWTMEFARAAT